jgi:hypothetical protein
MVNYGSVPDWIASVGTVLGLLWAVWLYRRELQRNRDRDDGARRAQASLVSAWFEPVDELSRRVIIANESSLPVSEVGVLVPSPIGGPGNLAVGLVPPKGRRVYDLNGYRERLFWPIPLDMWFVDSGGTRWHRDDSGVLRESSERQVPEEPET